MAGGQRDRQRKIRQARAHAEAAEARRLAARRRVTIGIVVAVAVVAGAFGAVAAFSGGGGGKSKATTPTTVERAAATKPCVAVADPLPAGAPEVPVKLGPPPAKLLTEDLKVGTGATVGAGDTPTINYIGVACSTGKIFDSSYKSGQPLSYPLSQLIPGWQDGIPGMKVGGRRLLGIPPDKAYGPAGQGESIGPNETLWFVVDVVDTKAG